MEKNLTIIDKDYLQWVKELALRYRQRDKIVPQVVGRLDTQENVPQVVGLFQVPWSHHRIIMDRVDGDCNKALFYVRKTIENGWSRTQLGNHWLPNYKSLKIK